MKKAKTENIIIIAVLLLVLCVTVAVVVLAPKLGAKEKDKESGTKNTTSNNVESTSETDEWNELTPQTPSSDEQESLKEEQRANKRQEMKTLMEASDYIIELEGYTFNMVEKYFDGDTLDGCFHMTVTSKDGIVFDENNYEVDENGFYFGKYGEDKWRYNFYSEAIYKTESNVVDNVLHIYTWMKEDVELKIYEDDFYQLGWIYDDKKFEESPETTNPDPVVLDKGATYSKKVTLDDGVEVYLTPTSIEFKGKVDIKTLSIIYSPSEELDVYYESDALGLPPILLDRVSKEGDTTTYYFRSVIRYDEVQAIRINTRKYTFD